MGGVRINGAAEVIRHGRPIQGLFAAGEVTGGVHGSNRLAGNSLLECVVFGRIAGQRAASILQGQCFGASFHSNVRFIEPEEKGYRIRLNSAPAIPNQLPIGTQIYVYGTLT
jgi:succinate dehydrogenase/fumarate reductase flavoprotein subunit